MLGITLTSYWSATGTRRAVVLIVPAAAAGRPAPARVAAALDVHGGLVVDRDAAGGDGRLIAELDGGEGLAAARAIVEEYVPRARRATGAIARPLVAADLTPPRTRERAA